MPTLATGEHLNSGDVNRPEQGFTLLEMLLVLVIVLIMVAAGVRMTTPGSLSSVAKQQGQWLVKKLSLMCEKSLFENRHLALEFNQSSHQFIEYTGTEWQTFDDEWLLPLVPEPTLNWSLFLQGRLQEMEPEFHAKPHVICDPNGQLSAFDIRIAGEADGQAFVYQLNSTGVDRIEQGWFDG